MSLVLETMFISVKRLMLSQDLKKRIKYKERAPKPPIEVNESKQKVQQAPIRTMR